MTNLTPIAALTAAGLSAALLTTTPASATPLGAAADMRLASEAASPVTSVQWWGHHRFHRPFFHHGAFRAFAFHRFHHRPSFFHRFHRCWWC
jgi:hypothetical protein